MRHPTLLSALLLSACSFDATEGAHTDEGTTGDDPATSLVLTAVTTASSASQSSSATSSPATTEGATSSSSGGATSSSSTGGSEDSSSTGADCAPIEVPVDGFVDEGEMRVVEFDFDQLPIDADAPAQLCLAFTTSNPASARSITIDGQVLTFGPCGGPPRIYCEEFLNPTGTLNVVLDNTTPSMGCQTGDMMDLVLFFGCVDESGSTGTGV